MKPRNQINYHLTRKLYRILDPMLDEQLSDNIGNRIFIKLDNRLNYIFSEQIVGQIYDKIRETKVG